MFRTGFHLLVLFNDRQLLRVDDNLLSFSIFIKKMILQLMIHFYNATVSIDYFELQSYQYNVKQIYNAMQCNGKSIIKRTLDTDI